MATGGTRISWGQHGHTPETRATNGFRGRSEDRGGQIEHQQALLAGALAAILPYFPQVDQRLPASGS